MLATKSLPHTAVGTGGAATPSEWTGELRVPAAATLKRLSLRDDTSAAGKGRGGSRDAQIHGHCCWMSTFQAKEAPTALGMLLHQLHLSTALSVRQNLIPNPPSFVEYDPLLLLDRLP